VGFSGGGDEILNYFCAILGADTFWVKLDPLDPQRSWPLALIVKPLLSPKYYSTMVAPIGSQSLRADPH
jgi:hypothetical protein